MSNPSKRIWMPKCSVPYCLVEERKAIPRISYHRFPTLPMYAKVKEKWTKVIRDSLNDVEWNPSFASVICSRHFLSTDFSGSSSKPTLLPTAIPTANLFPASVTPAEVELSDMEFEHSAVSLPPSLSLQGTFLPGDDVKLRYLKLATDLKLEITVKLTKDEDTLMSFQSKSFLAIDGSFSVSSAELIKVSEPSHLSPKARLRSNNVARTLFTGSTPERSTPVSYIASSLACKPLTPKSHNRTVIEHRYAKSPRSTCKKAIQKTAALRKKLRLAQRKSLVSRKRVKTLRLRLVDKLKECKFLGKNQLSKLQVRFPKLLNDLIDNEILASNVKSKKGVRYSEEMKVFANTLNFYSPRAYEFLRKYITLPHKSTLVSWMSSSPCDPGFNSEVIAKLTDAREQDTRGFMTDIVIQVDEMAIKKDSVWCPTKHSFVGFVTPENVLGGTDIVSQTETLASNALVLLIAGLKGGWKLPIAYFFTDKVDGTFLHKVIVKALELLEKGGFNTHAVISDGFSANVSMFEKLGMIWKPKVVGKKTCLDMVPIAYDQIKSVVPNPCNASKTIGCIMDVCHMQKVFRGTLAQCSGITDETGNAIEWSYIVKLHELQELEGVTAANKLGRNHIEFQRHKMKCSLSIQALSCSIADAIDFCRDDIKLDDFEGSAATTKFIKEIDKAFDILNSHNPAASGYKSPLSLRNFVEKSTFLEYFACRILRFTYVERRATKKGVTETKKLLCRGARHTAILGFCVSIKSISVKAKELLQRQVSPFAYVLTYRFSQDLIELLFNKIRGRLGRNNNPNVLEFKRIMKHLWHQNLLKSSNTGNCILQMEEDSIPGGLLPLIPKTRGRLNDDFMYIPFELSELHTVEYSQFKLNAMGYMAGHAVLAIKKHFSCNICVSALINSDKDRLDVSVRKLTDRKNNGGLVIPSQSAYTVIEITDSVFESILNGFRSPPTVQDLDYKIISVVLDRTVGMELFPTLGAHTIFFDVKLKEFHQVLLIKMLVRNYLRIRLFHLGKKFRDSLGVSNRHTLTKTILFNHE